MIEHEESGRLVEVLWEKTRHDRYVKPVFKDNGEVNYFVVHSNDVNETEHNQTSIEDKACYAIKLMESLISLMYKQGFTLPVTKSDSKLSTLEQKKKLITLDWKQMWTKMGRKENSNAISYNRMVLLESVISLLSFSVYQNNSFNYFLFFLSSYEKRKPGFCSLFLQSLIHQSMSYQENGALPYGGSIGGNSDTLRTSSISGLIASICLTREHQMQAITDEFDTNFKLYQIREHLTASSEEDKDIMEQTDDPERVDTLTNRKGGNGEEFNFKRDYLAKYIQGEDDEFKLRVWLDKFLKILRNPYDSEQTLLPGSMKRTELFDEVFYIFHRICRINGKFRNMIIMDPNTSSLNYILIYYLVDLYYNQGESTGLFEVIIALLMELSCDKTYCLNLNQPITESVLIEKLPVISGNYTDLFYVCFCYLLLESDNYMIYYANFLAIMKNM